MNKKLLTQLPSNISGPLTEIITSLEDRIKILEELVASEEEVKTEVKTK